MSIVFWLLVLGLTALSLWLLVRELRKPASSFTVDRQQQNKIIYQNQLTKLEQDYQNQLISHAEYSASLGDLEAFINEEVQQKPKRQINNTKDWLPYALLVLVPIISLSLYSRWGEYQTVEASGFAELEKQRHHAEFQQQIVLLEQSADAELENVEKQLMLANAYVSSGNLSSANKLLAVTYQRFPGNTDVMLMYAEVMGELNNRSLAGVPADLIRKASSLAPQSRKAQWLSSVLAVQEGEFPLALTLWQELLKTADEDSEKTFLKGLLAEVSKSSTAKENVVVDTVGPRVIVKVSLHQTLAKQVKADDSVFIFAKAYSESTEVPRVPVAILKKQVRDLPAEFVLSDANSMMPSVKLSAFERVVVGARISKTGDAIARSGDLQGLSEPVSTNSDVVITLVIADVVP